MSNLKVSTVQFNIEWENKAENLAKISKLLKDGLQESTDIIVLPEMFSTGFSMQPEKLAEKENGDTYEFMRSLALEYGCYVCGSFIVEENSKYYNRLLITDPQGNYKTYNKRHLFSMANEDKFYTAGDEPLNLKIKDWNIGFNICYDLRFPVWLRNRGATELMIFVANWPERRIKHWNTLLKARAIENQVYVVGVNRVGNDGNQIAHNGSTSVINPVGDLLYQCINEEQVKTIELSKEPLQITRRHMPFLNDADDFLLLKK